MFLPRIALEGDLDSIMLLIDHARAHIRTFGINQWQDGYPEREIILADIQNGTGWVFTEDEKIAGYAAIIKGREPIYDQLNGKWLLDRENYVTVHRVAIDDAWRGCGLGRIIMDHAAELGRSAGLDSLRADTHRGNLAMRGLLKKCGFALCGEVEYEVAAGDPVRVAYEKII